LFFSTVVSVASELEWRRRRPYTPQNARASLSCQVNRLLFERRQRLWLLEKIKILINFKGLFLFIFCFFWYFKVFFYFGILKIFLAF
jgi:hypothetical protein